MPNGDPLPFEHLAGQYLNLEVSIDGQLVRRSYTIASAPTRPAYCEISVKRISDGCVSRYLHEHWREGRRVKISAPAGRFHFTGEESQRIVLIAGGIGVTPMISVVRSLTDRGWQGEIYLLLSVSRVCDLVFGDELEYLRARFPNLHLLVTISSDPDAEWTGARGRITRELIEGFVPGLRNGPIMLCGPNPMMDQTRRVLVAMGVPDAEIEQEAFVSPRRIAGHEPAAPMEGEEEVEAGGPRTVRFERAGQSVEMLPGVTVLEAADDADVVLPHECRSGICGQCKTRLLSGRVAMDAQDALTAADRANGLILACQARAVDDLVVDA
jgi:ferredoxin-NADP reductase